jgi:hypothetical protein
LAVLAALRGLGTAGRAALVVRAVVKAAAAVAAVQR